jgi:hypothetical protein
MKDNWKNEKSEAAIKEGTDKIMKAAQELAKKEETLFPEKLEQANKILSETELPITPKNKTFEVCLGVGMNQFFPEYITIEVEDQLTKEEMDNYLKSIGGLANGYKIHSEPITDSNFFQCGQGWNNLIKNLIEDLIELGWDKQICQVKEKFGGLRFYINSADTPIHRRILEAEVESYNICEESGMPGELRKDLGWWRTLSDVEYQKLKDEKSKK